MTFQECNCDSPDSLSFSLLVHSSIITFTWWKYLFSSLRHVIAGLKLLKYLVLFYKYLQNQTWTNLWCKCCIIHKIREQYLLSVRQNSASLASQIPVIFSWNNKNILSKTKSLSIITKEWIFVAKEIEHPLFHNQEEMSYVSYISKVHVLYWGFGCHWLLLLFLCILKVFKSISLIRVVFQETSTGIDY